VIDCDVEIHPGSGIRGHVDGPEILRSHLQTCEGRHASQLQTVLIIMQIHAPESVYLWTTKLPRRSWDDTCSCPWLSTMLLQDRRDLHTVGHHQHMLQSANIAVNGGMNSNGYNKMNLHTPLPVIKCQRSDRLHGWTARIQVWQSQYSTFTARYHVWTCSNPTERVPTPRRRLRTTLA